MRRSAKINGVAVLFLFVIAALLLFALLKEDRGGKLRVTFLDIGQGDAIFIDSPSGRQVLIDGGPDSSVVRELSRVMPWYDRSIDVVVGTHPDADHIGGLIDVLPRYKVGMIVESSVVGSTDTWSNFEKYVKAEGAQHVVAQRGKVIQLGDGAYLEILAPDRVLTNAETNTACVVARLIYGITSFMFPCDAPRIIEDYLVSLDRSTSLTAGGSGLKSDVLKAGHHGSKTSSSVLFVGAVSPSYAVYSRGCDNKYGHPNQETVDTFARFEIPTLDTCTDGRVTFVSDGQTVTRR